MITVPRYVETMANSGHIKPLVNPNYPLLKGIKVDVYYNLHKKTFSIRCNGKVIAHRDKVTIKNPQYIVGEKGKQRVRREKSKNVHAFVRGTLMDNASVETWIDQHESMKVAFKVKYNPYVHDTFVTVFDGEPIHKSEWAVLSKKTDLPPEIWSY